MKSLSKLMYMMLAIALFTVSCKQAPEGEKATTGEAVDAQNIKQATGDVYTVDVANSSVSWEGTKVGGGHTGTFALKDGELTVDNGTITGGNFTIDMEAITITDDTPEDKKGWLIGHLKGAKDDNKDDFFNTSTYPTATFVITKVEAVEGVEDATHAITGNLTLKAATKRVTFNAKVEAGEGTLTATTPKFTIDRTEFGVMYGSKSVLSADQIKEKLIHHEVGLQVNLAASAAEATETD